MAALEEALAQAAARSSAARRAGDYDNADYWAGEVDNIQARITIRDHNAEWAILADNRHG